ncbi:MAG: DUF1287 domain-containing protein, partial [Pseudomonadales bacterium]|nr:DUF1287 domain-containing protein [Pseudomonadales bacterium]
MIIIRLLFILPTFLICTHINAGTTPSSQATQLVEAAIERTTHTVRYDGRYVAIDYPNGDVPPNIGVCTDVI